jgi:hypothetical protein
LHGRGFFSYSRDHIGWAAIDLFLP